MNYVTLTISFVTDFLITAGSTLSGAMVGSGSTQMPSRAVIVLACVTGLVTAGRRVQALIAPSVTAPR